MIKDPDSAIIDRKNVELYPADVVTCPDTMEPISIPALITLPLVPISLPLLPFSTLCISEEIIAEFHILNAESTAAKAMSVIINTAEGLPDKIRAAANTTTVPRILGRYDNLAIFSSLKAMIL